MQLLVLLSSLFVLFPTAIHALVANETLPPYDDRPYIAYAKAHPSFEEAATTSNMIQGVCYSPFHNKEYPLYGGSAYNLDKAMNDDFAIMKGYFSVVRTYYSSFYGVPVAPAAAANNVKLFLGVFMTNEGWYANQVTDAVNAVKQYPNTIAAILVGNENIAPVGPYSPPDVSRRITELRNRIQSETGRSVPIGTVQRAAEWLDPRLRTDMLALAANSDIVGVNIYPFFDGNYQFQYPLVILDAVWDQMLALYPASKVRLTEIGWPTTGAPPTWATQNVPNLSNAQQFYNAYVNSWKPSGGIGKEAFWFMFFDRSPADNTMGVELEKYFGFYTYDKKMKAANFPLRLTQVTTATTATPAPTPAPAPTTTSATTKAPAPTTALAPRLPYAGTSSLVCRVRKSFWS